MAGEVRFRIDGALEMERLLKQLGPRAAAVAADRALRAAAKPIVNRAKALVPVDTGELRDSITAALQPRRGGKEARVIHVGFKTPTSRRAHLVEYGTAHSSAQQFMRPALDEKAGEALAEMGRALGDGITREAERLAGVLGTKRRR